MSSEESRLTVRGGREDNCQHPATQLHLDEPLWGHNSLYSPFVYSKHTQELTQWNFTKTPADTWRHSNEHMYTHEYCTYQGKQRFSTGHFSQVDMIIGAFWFFAAVVLMKYASVSWLKINMNIVICHLIKRSC